MSDIFEFNLSRFLQVGVIAGVATIIFGLVIFLAGNAVVSAIAEKKIKGKLDQTQRKNIMLWTKIFGAAIILAGVLVAVLIVE